MKELIKLENQVKAEEKEQKKHSYQSTGPYRLPVREQPKPKRNQSPLDNAKDNIQKLADRYYPPQYTHFSKF